MNIYWWTTSYECHDGVTRHEQQSTKDVTFFDGTILSIYCCVIGVIKIIEDLKYFWWNKSGIYYKYMLTFDMLWCAFLTDDTWKRLASDKVKWLSRVSPADQTKDHLCLSQIGHSVTILLNSTRSIWLSLLLGDSRYIEEKLSECTRKNDEFNSLAKMTNSINCTKFSNN